MNAERLILFWLLMMCIAVGLSLTTPEPVGGHGTQHNTHTAMFAGSPTPPSDRILILGWMFGLASVGLFVTCMTLGITRRSERSDPLRYVLFGVGALLYAGVVTMMAYADRMAVRSGEVAYLGWFPAGTSWMLFGMWIAPLVFVAAYVIGFRRWILPPESMLKFEELVAVSRCHETSAGETDSSLT